MAEAAASEERYFYSQENGLLTASTAHLVSVGTELAEWHVLNWKRQQRQLWQCPSRLPLTVPMSTSSATLIHRHSHRREAFEDPSIVRPITLWADESFDWLHRVRQQLLTSTCSSESLHTSEREQTHVHCSLRRWTWWCSTVWADSGNCSHFLPGGSLSSLKWRHIASVTDRGRLHLAAKFSSSGVITASDMSVPIYEQSLSARTHWLIITPELRWRETDWLPWLRLHYHRVAYISSDNPVTWLLIQLQTFSSFLACFCFVCL